MKTILFELAENHNYLLHPGDRADKSAHYRAGKVEE